MQMHEAMDGPPPHGTEADSFHQDHATDALALGRRWTVKPAHEPPSYSCSGHKLDCIVLAAGREKHCREADQPDGRHYVKQVKEEGEKIQG